MPLDDDLAWPLLRSLDDPERLDAPRDYDHAATRARFDALVRRLDADFACHCLVDREVGAASRHGSIVVPAAALSGRTRITLTVSNFGRMVAATSADPNTPQVGAAPALVTPRHMAHIEAALLGCGYALVPDHILAAPYDGVHHALGRYTVEDEPTWWLRFFDYL